MKKILILTMGGTISASGKDRLDLKDYETGVYSGEYFLEQIPELKEVADVHIKHIASVSSTEVDIQHWILLRQTIEESFNTGDYDGVVITHGTNTLEETAYFLHLTVNSNKPVVVVGAQRPFTAMSSDAHLNLLAAVRVAANDASTNKGVLVVANDEISSAREVTKTNTYRLETFQSGQFGYLGFIEPDNTIQYYRTPTRKHTAQSVFTNISFDNIKNIEIIYSYAGATGELIRHITKSKKYEGIVMAGTGAGLFSPKETKALKEAREAGLFIVRSSRVGNGRVVAIDAYKELKTINADNLLPQKARILLMLSLLLYDDISDIQAIFDTY